MVNIKTKYVGLRKIKEITVTNELGLKFVLLNFGAALQHLYLDGKDLTYTNTNLKRFLYSGDYLGKIVGRTAGRIKDGKALINDQEYQIIKNGKHSLHGGKGFSFRPFQVEIKEDEENINVEFFYLSKDLECGFPGELEVKITYVISKKENKFKIDYKAISTKDTLCNLTSHTYWNLNSNKEDITNHYLKIDASKYVEVDNELIFKSIKDVNKVFDFRKGKQIKEDLYDQGLLDNALGYDHDFILDSNEVILENDEVKLVFNTTLPICHIYSGNYFKDRYIGVAIEFEKEAYDFSKILLKKDELYSHSTEYEIIKK